MLYLSKGREKQPNGDVLKSAPGISAVANLFRKKQKKQADFRIGCGVLVM